MMKRIFLLGVGLALLGACDRGDSNARAPDGAAAAGDTVGPAAYAERLLFLPVSDRDASVLFDFGARVDSAGVERSLQAWTAQDGAWTALDSAVWRIDRMREPWRMVPHGPLRLLVDADGDLEALVYRRETDPLRLLAGEVIGEWSPAQNARLRIRRAEVVVADGPRSGVLVDAHYRVDSLVASPADSVGAAYLTDGRGTHFVLLHGVVDDGAAWMREGARNRTWRGVRIEPTSFASAATAGDADTTAAAGAAPERTPTAWRLAAEDAAVSGELRIVGDSGRPGLYDVRGTVEVDGRRFIVHGVLRRGTA